ncbi:hypothetical protein GCM10023188_06170 [Pontibacter saemangeumensis]|uniref:Carboxypeptidase regulatory-like domain-containing protein n=1 Tax=Pontibacter saemangeumensis TaxID=1084525 RepID=A0ABP8LAL5_9BACT
MKTFIVLILSLLSLSGYCQNGQVTGQIALQDSLMEYKYLRVLLQKGESTVNGAVPDNSGHFVINDIPEGNYTLFIRQLGFRDAITDSVVVSDGETTTLNLPYPPPCRFTYEKGQKPKCIGGHSDGIIPIVYGLPTKKTMKKAEKGLVHLAGCIVTDCDPQYYCKIHNREL